MASNGKKLSRRIIAFARLHPLNRRDDFTGNLRNDYRPSRTRRLPRPSAIRECTATQKPFASFAPIRAEMRDMKLRRTFRAGPQQPKQFLKAGPNAEKEFRVGYWQRMQTDLRRFVCL